MRALCGTKLSPWMNGSSQLTGMRPWPPRLDEYDWNSRRGDFLYSCELVRRGAAVVGIAADHESLGSGGHAGLRGGVVAADISRDHVDARQLADFAHIELGAKRMAAGRRIIETDLIFFDMSKDAAP